VLVINYQHANLVEDINLINIKIRKKIGKEVDPDDTGTS
jgi:hypothetical protein